MTGEAWSCPCGRDNVPDGRFCSECGRARSLPEPQPVPAALSLPSSTAWLTGSAAEAGGPAGPPTAGSMEPSSGFEAEADPTTPPWPSPSGRPDSWDTNGPATTLSALPPTTRPMSSPSPFLPGPVRPKWLTPTPQNLAVGIVAVIAVVAILVVVTTSGISGPGTQANSASPGVTLTVTQVLTSKVEELSHYVERARGLKFLHPVKAAAYGDAEFDANFRALSGARLDRVELAGRVATLEALGVLPPNYDPAKDDSQSTSNILGYYDPATKQIAVRGDCCSIYVQQELIHELTHALQDQHFDLQRLTLPGVDDRALAQRSLFEGDAFRIQQDWVSTLSADEQNALERQARQRGDELFPAGFLIGFGSFPYVVGGDFTRNLIAIGGHPLLDKAFANPPLSTKEVIQPQAYVSNDAPRAVGPPPADGPVVDQGTIGQFDLIYVLGEVISLSEAAGLSSDWGGSSFVTWRAASGPCIRVRLTTEHPGGAPQMLLALHTWASAAGSRSVVGTNPITITACV